MQGSIGGKCDPPAPVRSGRVHSTITPPLPNSAAFVDPARMESASFTHPAATSQCDEEAGPSKGLLLGLSACPSCIVH